MLLSNCLWPLCGIWNLSKNSQSQKRESDADQNIVYFLLQINWETVFGFFWIVQEDFGNVPITAAKLFKNQEQRPTTAQQVVHSSN